MCTLDLAVYMLRNLGSKQRGQGLTEYALILTLVFLVVLVVLLILGPAVGNMYNNIMDNLAVLNT